MAIYLPQPDLLFVEFPRTGTTWLRNVLGYMKIPHRFPEPSRRVCPRHSPAACYNISARQVICTVRRPSDWVESWWKFLRGIGTDLLEPGREYVHAPLYPVETTFSVWLERTLRETPGAINTVYREMTSGCTALCCFERYEADLSSLLNISEERLLRRPFDNVSRPHPVDWSDLLRSQFESCTVEAWRIWRTTQ